MNAVIAVWKKEIGVYFHAFIFYFFGMTFLFIVGVLLWFSLFYYLRNTPMGGGFNAQQLVQGVFSSFDILLLMFMPFYTMRLLAEERRQGSLELLFTSPVTASQIAIGKFLAAFVLLAGITGLPLLYPLVLSMFTKIDWPPALAAYLGVLLLGGSYIALGLFCSSLTHNQLISAVLSIGGFLIFWLVGFMGAGTPAQPVFKYLSLVTHYQGFVQGSLHTQDAIYYMSFIFIWLFLTNRSLESQGWR